MGKRTLRVAAAVAVVLIGAFATVGEGSTGSSGSGGNKAPNANSESGSTKPGDTKPSAEGTVKAEPIPIGTEIKVSSGWDFKVNSAELNANDALKQASEANSPDAGKQFVMVNLSMINKSGKPDTPLMNLKVSLLPSSGVAIDSSFTISVPDECDVSTQLQPDAVYTCNEVFEVKSEEADTSLLLVEPQFTMNENDAQRFFALK